MPSPFEHCVGMVNLNKKCFLACNCSTNVSRKRFLAQSNGNFAILLQKEVRVVNELEKMVIRVSHRGAEVLTAHFMPFDGKS